MFYDSFVDELEKLSTLKGRLTGLLKKVPVVSDVRAAKARTMARVSREAGYPSKSKKYERLLAKKGKLGRRPKPGEAIRV